MKKKILAMAIILVVACSLLLVACSSGSTIKTVDGAKQYFEDLKTKTNYTVTSNSDGYSSISKRDGDKVYSYSEYSYEGSDGVKVEQKREYYFEKVGDTYYAYEKDEEGNWTKYEDEHQAHYYFEDGLDISELVDLSKISYNKKQKLFVFSETETDEDEDGEAFTYTRSGTLTFDKDGGATVTITFASTEGSESETYIVKDVGSTKVTLPTVAG